MPLPEVVEGDSEACWTLWDEVIDSQWSHSPSALLWRDEGQDALVPEDAPLSLAHVLGLARRNQRVCPLPGKWLALHDVLTLDGARQFGPAAPRPLCCRTWSATSALTKRLRLRDQIAWAADYGGLRGVYEYLHRLHEDDWLHFSPPPGCA